MVALAAVAAAGGGAVHRLGGRSRYSRPAESDEKPKVAAYATKDSPKWARTGGRRTAVFSRSAALVIGLSRQRGLLQPDTAELVGTSG